MASGPNFTTNSRAEISRALDLVEEAQAVFARVTQETAKLGGGTAASAGTDWDAQGITAQQFYDGLGSAAAMSDILGAHGTNLYRLKV